LTEPACCLRLDARALRLGYQLGAEALLILLDLAAHSSESTTGLIVVSSYRDLARRLGISKDTVGRRMALLRRAGLIVERSSRTAGCFGTPCYVLNLDGAGVTREEAAASR
jgi:DNA-binding transcriptional ArsR family regulator